MPSVFTQAQLQHLRAGDLVTYGGVQWEVADYSSYDDDNGYATEEWLLKTTRARSYYLLREVDPENPTTLVNWYLSEEISGSSVSGESFSDNLQFTMWRVMREGEQPYPHLRALGKEFYFESQTDGKYRSDKGKASRTTWDYWDQDHLWNLAIEAWEDREIHFYSTKKVNPEDFSEVKTDTKKASFTSSRKGLSKSEQKKIQIVMAWALTIGGILLMIFGGW
ncbi:hypothetical protein APA_3577 [Pseudanabaena sp. lw0831]|uniref:DUF4178 domain-containing protein n=1 Tax=Pseudanabaena sp. lw0831 TaxID=1357935 RepID=UPI001916A311|nr:DUF4178 domain-containing protein [Pseudanabaena sp. lw0831]GBO55426.1 hypothetical protein APA_3577 [Pseudanabaena sp. lw0831]